MSGRDDAVHRTPDGQLPEATNMEQDIVGHVDQHGDSLSEISAW